MPKPITTEKREKIIKHKHNSENEADIARWLFISESSVTKLWTRFAKLIYITKLCGVCLSLDGFVVYWFLWKGELMEVIGKMPDVQLKEMLNSAKPPKNGYISICKHSQNSKMAMSYLWGYNGRKTYTIRRFTFQTISCMRPHRGVEKHDDKPARDRNAKSGYRVKASSAHKLCNPCLKEIRFHTFRHWNPQCFTITKDPFYVQEYPGHKCVLNTQLCVQIIRNSSQTINKKIMDY